MKKKHENISFSRFVPMMDSMRDRLFVWLPCMGENQEKDRRAIASLLYWLKSRLFNCHPKFFCLLPGYSHVSLMTRWRQWCLGQAFSGCRWPARWEQGNWHNCCFPIRFSVWYHALRSDRYVQPGWQESRSAGQRGGVLSPHVQSWRGYCRRWSGRW